MTTSHAPFAEPLPRTTVDSIPASTGEGRTALRTSIPQGKDARALAADLRLKLKGEVRFDDGSRALYATDGSNYRQVPIGVVVPKDADDVVATFEACRRRHAPIVARGGGTSLAGQCCNVAVVVDSTKYMDRILDLDPHRRTARVQPGVVLDSLRHAALPYGLNFAPDPSTHNHCTLGGMIGNNSCGTHSVYGGKTVENVERLEVLLYDGTRVEVGGKLTEDDVAGIVRAGGPRGELYRRLRLLRDRDAPLIRERYPKIPRRVSGYNLDQLLPENGFDVAKALVGTEGTCVFVLEATVRLLPWPKARSLLVLGFDDIFAAADHVPRIVDSGCIACEGVDDRLITDIQRKELHQEYLKLFPEGKGFLLVEMPGDTKKEADAKAAALVAKLKASGMDLTSKIYDDDEEEKHVWKIRELGLGATARIPGAKDTWEGWEDSAVPPARLGEYLRIFRKKLDDFGYGCSLYGHFGQGCVHTRIDFDLESKDGIAKYRRFVEEMAEVVVSLGGSLSGEHGDGQSRAELLPKMYGPELIRAFREFKAIWDPDGKMNPGKVVDPYRLDENLRLGTHYGPPRMETFFQFPEDRGDFRYATQRCVGVGECRKHEGGTMCPSYMVTREEMHSTRGRAHMLFELLVGDPLERNWKNEHVKEALDLCLSCKGCKGECPVNVDMPTYKAEFLAHYYEGRIRPPHAIAFGMIDVWSKLASIAPRLANFFAHAPVLSSLLKAAIGVAPERALPAFAPRTFRRGFARDHHAEVERVDGVEFYSRPAPRADSKDVILWADTFNEHFHPEVAHAAVEVLEAAGFRVLVTKKRLCCGRPLYDYGMLKRAKGYLTDILETLREPIRRGVPVVGLEPSCVSVFRDELVGLLPNDEDAIRLQKQTYLLSDFLAERAPDLPLKLHRQALVHGHCHQRAILKMDGESRLYRRVGLEVEMPETGCCGMAGAFGFEKDHYDVSIACGERKLLPAVRHVPKDTLVVSNGFSCREQIAQTTDRRALHVAQVLKMALDHGPGGAPGPYPEAQYDPRQPGAPLQKTKRASRSALAVSLAVLLVLALSIFLLQCVRG